MDAPKDQSSEQKPATVPQETAEATSAPVSPEAPSETKTETPSPTQPGQPMAVEPAAEPVPPKIESFLQQPNAQKPLTSDSHHTKSFMTKLLLLLIVILFVIAGALAYIISNSKKEAAAPVQANVAGNVSPTVSQVSPTPEIVVDWTTYSNGVYSFEYPSTWKAVNNPKGGTLFGPNATVASSEGGIDVKKGMTVEQYMANSAQYTNKESVTVDGITGVKADYSGTVMGTTVVFVKGTTLYGIYLNSDDKDELKLFEHLISTFTFSPKPSSSPSVSLTPTSEVSKAQSTP